MREEGNEMKRFVGMGLAVTTMMLAPSAAFADDAPPASVPAGAATTTESPTATVDTIHLRSGGLFRGRVTEILPGDHVTVVLPTGETKRFPWVDVDRVIVASTTVPPPPPSSTVPAAMVGPRARVHIKSSGHRVTLFRRPAGSTELVAACDSPCDIELPIGDTYRVGGSGLSTTPEFMLAAKAGGSVDITVDGPNWFGIVSGGVLTLGGGITAYVGVIFALAGSGNSRSSIYGNSESVRNAGLAAIAIGAVAIGLGLAIVYPSLKTDLSQQTGAARDAFVRTPTWRTASATGVEGQAVPMTFSLFEKRF